MMFESAVPPKRLRPMCGQPTKRGTKCKRKVWPPGARCAGHPPAGTTTEIVEIVAEAFPGLRNVSIENATEEALQVVKYFFERLQRDYADGKVSDEAWYVGLVRYTESIRKLHAGVISKTGILAKAGLDNTMRDRLEAGHSAMLSALDVGKGRARGRLLTLEDGSLDRHADGDEVL